MARRKPQEAAEVADDVTKAAEAAAVAAAHAVEAARAAQEVSKLREGRGSGRPSKAAVDAARNATEAAGRASAHATTAAKLADAPVEPALEATSELPAVDPKPDQPTEPTLTPPTEHVADTAQSETEDLPDEEEPSDLLGLDDPKPKPDRVLARLGGLAILCAAGSFAISALLASLFAKGSLIDILILIAWLGVVLLSIAGILLLAAAGVMKIVERYAKRPTTGG